MSPEPPPVRSNAHCAWAISTICPPGHFKLTRRCWSKDSRVNFPNVVVVHNLAFKDCRVCYTEYSLANHSGVIIYRLGTEPVSILLLSRLFAFKYVSTGRKCAPFPKLRKSGFWSHYVACGNRPPDIVTTAFKLGHIVKQWQGFGNSNPPPASHCLQHISARCNECVLSETSLRFGICHSECPPPLRVHCTWHHNRCLNWKVTWSWSRKCLCKLELHPLTENCSENLPNFLHFKKLQKKKKFFLRRWEKMLKIKMKKQRKKNIYSAIDDSLMTWEVQN